MLFLITQTRGLCRTFTQALSQYLRHSHACGNNYCRLELRRWMKSKSIFHQNATAISLLAAFSSSFIGIATQWGRRSIEMLAKGSFFCFSVTLLTCYDMESWRVGLILRPSGQSHVVSFFLSRQLSTLSLYFSILPFGPRFCESMGVSSHVVGALSNQSEVIA